MCNLFKYLLISCFSHNIYFGNIAGFLPKNLSEWPKTVCSYHYFPSMVNLRYKPTPDMLPYHQKMLTIFGFSFN